MKSPAALVESADQLAIINAELAHLFHCEPVDLSLGADAAMADELVICGILGGKDVGKTTIINALAGSKISDDTREVGRGTQRPLAYVHEEVAEVARSRLASAVPGTNVDIVTHRAGAVRNAVLLDLPDFDSEFPDHLDIVRHVAPLLDRVLWVQTPRKIGDRAWSEMFRDVIKDPRNVTCVLNKFDELLADGRLPDNGSPAGTDHDAIAASFWNEQEKWVARFVEPVAGRLDSNRLYLIAAAFTDRDRFVAEIARRWDDPHWTEFAHERSSVSAIAERASADLNRLRRRLLDPVTAEEASAIKNANRAFERQFAAERIRTYYDLDRTICALANTTDAEYLQSVMSEGIGPRFVQEVTWQLATHVRRATVLADELLERRVEGWPLLRLTYWPLGFLSRALGRRLEGGAARRTESAGDPLQVDGIGIGARVDSIRSRLLADAPPTVLRMRIEEDVPDGDTIATRASSTAHRLVPQFEAQLLDEIQCRDRCPSFLARTGLWLILLWFPFLQPLLEGGLQVFLEDGTFALASGLYHIVSAFSAVHLLAGFAVVAAVFAAILAGMYARALRAVRTALSDERHGGVPTLHSAVETMLAEKVLLPLVIPFQTKLSELSELQARLQSVASL